jgi:hypothetical protein
MVPFVLQKQCSMSLLKIGGSSKQIELQLFFFGKRLHMLQFVLTSPQFAEQQCFMIILLHFSIPLP